MVMERMSMMLFAIIIMINMTLLAVNQTGDVALFGGKGFQLNNQTLQALQVVIMKTLECN